MTIQRVPSIWDSIAEGLSAGQAGYNQQDAINKQQEQQRFQNLMGLFQNGGVDSADLNASPVIKGMGVTVQPNQAELRRKATGPGVDLSGAVGAATGSITPPGTVVAPKGVTMTADQRAVAGLPDLGTLSSEQTVATLNKIKQRIASGDQTVSDREYELVGMKTPDQIKVDKLKSFDPVIEQKAKNFVDGIFATHGGRLSPQQATAAAEQAYQQYVAERTNARLGVLTPEQQSYARAYFNSAVMDRLHEQRQQDIAELQASNGRLSEHDRLYAELQSTAAMHAKAMEELMKGPGGAMFATMTPEEVAAKAPAFAGVAREYAEHKEALRRLAKAQQQVIVGAGRDAITKTLQGTQTNDPGGNVNLGGNTTNVPDMTAPQYYEAVQKLKAMPDDTRKAYIQQNKNSLSAADQAKLKARFPEDFK